MTTRLPHQAADFRQCDPIDTLLTRRILARIKRALFHHGIRCVIVTTVERRIRYRAIDYQFGLIRFGRIEFLFFRVIPDPPQVTLRLGSTLSAEDIKEGDDVYFECHVHSNPPWRKLSWMHNVSFPSVFLYESN